MLINLVCAIVFFLCVPGILFTIPIQDKYLMTAAHAVVFVIVHHFVNAYLKATFGMEEPRMENFADNLEGVMGANKKPEQKKQNRRRTAEDESNDNL